MKTWWLAGLAALFLASLAGCPTKQEACASSCSGCCDARGVCQSGLDQSACGAGGAACEDCFRQHGACFERRCIPAPDGGGAGGGTGGGGGGGGQAACSTTCSGCCDSSGTCVAGTEQQACGQQGAACVNCILQHGACFNQQCIPAYDGGGPGGGTGGGSGGGGGSDAGAPADAGTYPDGGSPYRYWDGGSCAVATNCPCFSSDDCGPGFYCHSQDNTGANVFCVPGARGTGRPGDTCSGEADCASALCTDSTSSGMKCSALCDVAAECPTSLPRCIYIGFGVDRSICSPP